MKDDFDEVVAGGRTHRGVVLLSGGLDSAVTAWIAKGECGDLYTLTFHYGQAHSKEIRCASELSWALGVRDHKVLGLPLNLIGGSSLFNKDEIPTSEVEGIPSTWVPQRNSIFLAIAFGWTETLGCDRVYIGVNSVDYSGYPDCRPEFIKKMSNALNLASKKYVESDGRGFIEVHTPLSGLSKAEIIKKGAELGVPFRETTSCYKGEEEACGSCSSCRLRLKGFREAGLVDPIKYRGG